MVGQADTEIKIVVEDEPKQISGMTSTSTILNLSMQINTQRRKNHLITMREEGITVSSKPSQKTDLSQNHRGVNDRFVT